MPISLVAPPNEPGTDVKEKELYDRTKAIVYRAHAKDLIWLTMGNCANGPKDRDGRATIVKCKSGEKSDFPGPKDYIVIHAVTWKDKIAGKPQDIDKENWYVFNQGDGDWDEAAFSKNNRIFGRRNVYLLYLYFNYDPTGHSMRYTLDSKSKIPAYLDHFVGLLQLFGMGTSGGGGGEAKVEKGFWDATSFDTYYVPSDITFTPEIVPDDGSNTVTLTSKTFDNEGRYHTDFSVGVPIRKISELSFVSSSNTIVAAKVQKQDLFAFFNYYPKAFDIKSSAWDKYPHVLGGVALASQPLKKVIIGAGYGPIYAHFYAGLLIHTYQLPKGSSCGSTPTSSQLMGATLTNHTCAEFSVGLNVAVGAIADALKSKGSSK
ncbi:MAG TPA: hypothetical protein VGR97_07190 [Candidatus Acidoferrales bacterium]|nr:hypothetical protein [Candidatus Acidoferrales bacterium]